MPEKLGKWLNTFIGAMCMAVFSFICLFNNVILGYDGLAWLMGILTVYWLYRAWKNTKRSKVEVKLTPAQTAKIEEATKDFHTTLREIEREITQELRKAKEKEKEKAEGDHDDAV